MKEFDYKLPTELETLTIKGDFYIRMNKHYVATIRNLRSFIDYIKRGDIDDTFGEVIKVEREHTSNLFNAHLYMILEKALDFKTFNNNPHKFVKLNNDDETISIRTKNGQKLTIAILEKSNCIDIKLHTKEETFKVMGFNKGKTPIGQTEVTLTTILLK